MDITQALEHATAQSFPGFLTSDEEMQAERIKHEDALRTLLGAWGDKGAAAGFSYELIRSLADRNRALCDQFGIERLENLPTVALQSKLPDIDLVRGVAAMQGRSPEEVQKTAGADISDLAAAYLEKPVSGAVIGIDLETTDREPTRGYIVNLGLEFWNIAPDTHPVNPSVAFFGMPEMYKEKGVPLERIHHISWEQIEGRPQFRDNKEMHKTLVELLSTLPYMAHNAAFEDSWLSIHVDGYAEARAAGKIVILDSRDMVRRLDPDYRNLSRESRPAALESWAKRRGTLAADESERHLGLEDVDLMFRTVQAEFKERNMF